MIKSKVYSEMLDELFSSYSGDYENLLKKIPSFFKMLQDIYSYEDLSWDIKFKINACFSYFAVPTDIIPDDLGPEGYLDDLFVCVYVLKNLIPEHSILLLKYWKHDEDIINLIKETFQEVSDILGKKTSEILNFIGLSKFDEMGNELAFLEIPKNSFEKLRRIKLETIDLLALLKTIMAHSGFEHTKIYTHSKLIDFKNSFNKKEWEEVEKILERIKSYEEIFDNKEILEKDILVKNTKIQMEEIRRKVALEIDQAFLEE